MSGLWQIAFVLALAMFMLFALDWRITKAFRNHEAREEKMHATAVLLADTAAATAREAGRHIHELRAETAAIRFDLTNLSELVRVHEARISDAEMKLLRSSLVVPRRAPEGS